MAPYAANGKAKAEKKVPKKVKEPTQFAQAFPLFTLNQFVVCFPKTINNVVRGETNQNTISAELYHQLSQEGYSLGNLSNSSQNSLKLNPLVRFCKRLPTFVHNKYNVLSHLAYTASSL